MLLDGTHDNTENKSIPQLYVLLFVSKHLLIDILIKDVKMYNGELSFCWEPGEVNVGYKRPMLK